MNRFERINLALLLTSIGIIVGCILMDLAELHIEVADVKRIYWIRIADALKAHPKPLQPSSTATEGKAHAEVSQPHEGGDVG